jgi:hypothetical protein
MSSELTDKKNSLKSFRHNTGKTFRATVPKKIPRTQTKKPAPANRDRPFVRDERKFYTS